MREPSPILEGAREALVAGCESRRCCPRDASVTEEKPECVWLERDGTRPEHRRQAQHRSLVGVLVRSPQLPDHLAGLEDARSLVPRLSDGVRTAQRCSAQQRVDVPSVMVTR